MPGVPFLRKCVTHTAPRKILIIQTDFEDGVHSAQLIASAKCVLVFPLRGHGRPRFTGKSERVPSQKAAQPQINTE